MNLLVLFFSFMYIKSCYPLVATVLLVFFLIFMTCISFSCLIVLARTSTIKVTRVGILVLFLILKESFELNYDVSCELVIYDFYYVSICSLYTHFIESFYHKWMFNFVRGIFCICWDYHMIFILHFVSMVHYIDWFVNIEPCFRPWNKQRRTIKQPENNEQNGNKNIPINNLNVHVLNSPIKRHKVVEWILIKKNLCFAFERLSWLE